MKGKGKENNLKVKVTYHNEKWEMSFDELPKFIKSKTNIDIDKDDIKKIKEGWQCSYNNYKCEL